MTGTDLARAARLVLDDLWRGAFGAVIVLAFAVSIAAVLWGAA